MNIVNIGKSDANISLTSIGKKIQKVTDVLTGVSLDDKLMMKPNEVRLIEISLN